MTITAADLTTAFPEFDNAALFPPTQVAFWVGIANETLPAGLFGDRLSLAAILFVAHNLALSTQSRVAAAGGSGAAFGSASGPVTSKSAGPVSKSMDVTLSAYQGAGPWNLTGYGQRYYQLIKGFASGPFYAVKQVQAAIPGYGAIPI